MNNPNLLGLLTAPTTVGSGDWLGITSTVIIIIASETLLWNDARAARWLCKARYLLTVSFLECRYRFRMLVLHLGYLPVRVEKLLLPVKCFLFRRKIARLNRLIERLYLLDESRCLTVLDSLNKLNRESGNLGDGFLCGHKIDVAVKPNEKS